MLFFGILFGILGAVGYFYGNSMNNDAEAQLKSFFETGKTNPGDPFKYIGIALIVLGVLLILASIIRSASKSGRSKDASVTVMYQQPYYVPAQNNMPPAAQNPAQGRVCGACGCANPPANTFCAQCGAALATKRICRQCGAALPAGNTFCGRCGAPYAGQ